MRRHHHIIPHTVNGGGPTREPASDSIGAAKCTTYYTTKCSNKRYLRVTTFALALRRIVITHRKTRQTTTDDGDVDGGGRTRVLAGKSTRHL